MGRDRARSDAELIEACLHGEAEAGPAWAALVGRHADLVYTLLRRYGLDEEGAAAAFQATWSELWERLPEASGRARLVLWLLETAGRLAAERAKRPRRLHSVSAH